MNPFSAKTNQFLYFRTNQFLYFRTNQFLYFRASESLSLMAIREAHRPTLRGCGGVSPHQRTDSHPCIRFLHPMRMNRSNLLSSAGARSSFSSLLRNYMGPRNSGWNMNALGLRVALEFDTRACHGPLGRSPYRAARNRTEQGSSSLPDDAEQSRVLHSAQRQTHSVHGIHR